MHIYIHVCMYIYLCIFRINSYGCLFILYTYMYNINTYKCIIIRSTCPLLVPFLSVDGTNAPSCVTETFKEDISNLANEQGPHEDL
jgi:hypothetical protein